MMFLERLAIRQSSAIFHRSICTCVISSPIEGIEEGIDFLLGLDSCAVLISQFLWRYTGQYLFNLTPSLLQRRVLRHVHGGEQFAQLKSAGDHGVVELALGAVLLDHKPIGQAQQGLMQAGLRE